MGRNFRSLFWAYQSPARQQFAADGPKERSLKTRAGPLNQTKVDRGFAHQSMFTLLLDVEVFTKEIHSEGYILFIQLVIVPVASVGQSNASQKFICKDLDGALVVCDVTNAASLEQVSVNIPPLVNQAIVLYAAPGFYGGVPTNVRNPRCGT